MTEDYWLASTDPAGMLRWLLADVPAPPAGRPSRRQVRLLAAAFADRHAYTLPRAGRQLFRFAERFIENERDRSQVWQIAGRRYDVTLPHWAVRVLSDLVGPLPADAHYPWLTGIHNQLALELGPDGPAQADIIRDIVGDPFREPPPFADEWRTAAAIGLARAATAGRRWDRLPLLADALEEAGCDDEELLAHCRSTGPHVLGCWAADRVLGRNPSH